MVHYNMATSSHENFYFRPTFSRARHILRMTAWRVHSRRTTHNCVWPPLVGVSMGKNRHNRQCDQAIKSDRLFDTGKITCERHTGKVLPKIWHWTLFCKQNVTLDRSIILKYDFWQNRVINYDLWHRRFNKIWLVTGHYQMRQQTFREQTLLSLIAAG